MVCLGLEPRAVGWKAQTNPLSYVGTLAGLKFNKTGFEQFFNISKQFNPNL